MIRCALALIVTALTLLGGDTVKIASYNVENLFDLNYDGTEYLEYIPGTSWEWNREHYDAKLRNIARVIADIGADAIALQEVESLEALRDLKAAVKRAGLYYPHMAIAGAKNTTVKVALLSRFPILYTKEISVGASRKQRAILEARLDVEGAPLYLFVNHWKSKSGPESRRVVAAKALRKRLEALGHDTPILLVGDFNSHYEEYRLFLRKRKHNDTEGITGINHILRTVTDGAPVTLEALRRCDGCYYNLWYELPESQRWSHNFYGQKEGLDNMILSPGLADGRGIDYLPGSFRRFTPDYLFKKRAIFRWQQSRKHPKHHTGEGFSDHLPVYAEFTLLPK
jgi:endonuclease/exonuclease/phosphatase family metal-dependent hydrolase